MEALDRGRGTMPSTSTRIVPSGSRNSWSTRTTVPDLVQLVVRRIGDLAALLRGDEQHAVARHGLSRSR